MTILRAPIFQPFLLMGAHSSIPMLSDVAVATQELQSARESVVDDPAKKNVTNTNLFAVFGAVVILVINREKSGFIFPAAGTFCAIVIKDYFLKISVVPTMSRISITLFPLMFCLVISRKFHHIFISIFGLIRLAMIAPARNAHLSIVRTTASILIMLQLFFLVANFTDTDQRNLPCSSS